MIQLSLALKLFVLLNPLSSFPFLMAAYKNKMNVQRIAIISTLTGFLIAIVIIAVGPYLFDIFGITLDAFRIAGGIILFLLGINMVRPPERESIDIESIDSMTTIIATPMLTGPATISFITIKTFEVGKVMMLANTTVGFLLVGTIFFIFSYMIPKVNPKIIGIISRILGLFLTAVSIEMIATGVKAILI